MSKIKTNAFFCEDVRLDNEGKPMFIGVLSPVGWVDEVPFSVDHIEYVTLFHVDRTVDEFTARLSIHPEGDIGGLKSNKDSFKRTFTRPDDLEEDEEEWMAISHLRLKDLNFSHKATLRAVLTVNSDEIVTIFQVRATELPDATLGENTGSQTSLDDSTDNFQ